MRPAADNQSKIAILEVHGAGAWLWLPSAVAAWWDRNDRLALGAFAKLRRFTALALLLRLVRRTLVDLECPLDPIFREAMAVDGAGVVEDDAIVLVE